MADKNDEFVGAGGGGGGGGGGSFSQLLFSNEDNEMDDNNLKFSSFSASKTPKMLCFGNYLEEEEDKDRVFCYQTVRTVQKSTVGVTCSDSSSASSSCNTNSNNNNGIKSPSISNKKRNGSCTEPAKTSQPIGIGTPPVESQGNCKKSKNENPTSATGRAKVRKEKLGERITALQQLVSPFGKTDTASVLHEAMGYIRFLHEQVQVLCSPYLQRLPSSSSANLHHCHGGDGQQLPPIGGEKGEDESRKGLKSRGLCLVPVACTALVANSNGADFWSPAMANNNSSGGNNNSSISKS